MIWRYFTQRSAHTAVTCQMSTTTNPIDPQALSSFHEHLSKSTRILALLGAGISASSGLPTFRGAGGLWRTHDAVSLATPEAFRRDPVLVWQFYSYRRHMALNAKPNPAHMALVELSRKNPNFLTLSQNVDGLSPRAGHPEEQLKLLHGNLFDTKCWDEQRCRYFVKNDFTDPIVPALAIPAEVQATEAELQSGQHDHSDTSDSVIKPSDIRSGKRSHPLVRGSDISDISNPLPNVTTADLPQCPKCKSNLLRPGVVWFGESLPRSVLAGVDEYISNPARIDLIIVIGTSSKVYPAAGYTEIARSKGARVCVVNMDEGDARNLRKGDWFFKGDAAVIVPELLKPIIGDVPEYKE